VCIDIVLAVP